MLRVVQNLVVLADDIVTNKGYEKVVQQKDPVAIKSSTDSSTDEQISHTTSVEINEEMRSTLADRLIEEFHCYELVPETLYLTFYIVDQYLSREKVMETDLMLVGVGAMLIASKYEDPRPIGMEDMVFFFSELGLMPYSFITFWPSLVAASAVYAARCTLKKTPRWTEMLVEYTGYSEQQLL
ncbi:hypothetical protein B296_00004322 [Ensete ventricosum]|uniref:Cyclin-like domain-containing protein n=1 Tax=Ensete ventricosum TaxID=4639 RepID=A0A426ZK56_ENSVE|nr:hypothetical protein B296_00004322 [Ensete ventricosum]